VFPALAVGEELERRGWRVSYTGTATGMEAQIASSRGLDFHALEAAAVTGRGVLDSARALLVLLRSTGRARDLVRRLDARAVVATGGYACVPAALGARTLRRPVVLVEPNATPGLANRALSRIASHAAVAWPEAARALHCPSSVTGVPVRQAFFEQSAPLPPSPPWHVLVLGGSQGAATLNQVVPRALEALRQAHGFGVSVLHQAGRGKVEATREAYASTGVVAEVATFLDDVPAAMAGAHLVLSRAGAVTLAEIAAAGRPALLFPLHLAAGHQVENARALERAGAAEVVEPREAADVGVVAARLARLFDRQRLESMAAAARTLARPAAAASIADLVDQAVAR
jgi:UDP-N-acetylglucosamine--N-acetylmuramyl-(pentapeptide) pyrophosphoryl-undecaprenol N-acetylglucosamine transferase